VTAEPTKQEIDMRHYLMTAHQQFVGRDEAGALVQTRYVDDIKDRLVILPDFYDLVLKDGPLKGFCMLRSGENSVSFSKDGLFLCAEPFRPDLVHNRVEIGPWEKFLIVREEVLSSQVAHFNESPEQEIARFSKTVSRHIEHQDPVKLYLGCGPVPRPGFLNLDIFAHAPEFVVSNPDEYFIFPYADRPGQYHRINTPNLLTAMKENSDFSKGFVGVYTGELRWGHVSLFSPASLKEMAEMVGYREVVFTTKNHGVSAFSEADFRPGSDRDDIFGNIYADLLK